jgi:TRAP-type C4-dicarboxylate transport system permease small subunit
MRLSVGDADAWSVRQRLIALTFLGACVLVFSIATGFWTWMLFTGANEAARDRAEYFAWHWGCAMTISLVIWTLYLVQTIRGRAGFKSATPPSVTPIRW